jgi:L-amino acid N-acyltransferase YncA
MQGNGVGRRLLDMAVQEAHACGLWPVLDVVANGRPAAEGWFCR